MVIIIFQASHLNFKISVQVLIPEDNVVRVFLLVGGKRLHIGIDFFGFTVISELWLSWSEFIFAIKVVMGKISLVTYVPGTIEEVLILILGRPISSSIMSIVLLLVINEIRSLKLNKSPSLEPSILPFV